MSRETTRRGRATPFPQHHQSNHSQPNLSPTTTTTLSQKTTLEFQPCVSLGPKWLRFLLFGRSLQWHVWLQSSRKGSLADLHSSCGARGRPWGGRWGALPPSPLVTRCPPGTRHCPLIRSRDPLVLSVPPSALAEAATGALKVLLAQCWWVIWLSGSGQNLRLIT